MSRSGNVWDNAAMESFFSSLKTERTARRVLSNTRRGQSRRVRFLVDGTMNANSATKPRMMPIKNLAKNSPVGVLNGVRKAGWVSLSACQRNRVQANAAYAKAAKVSLDGLCRCILYRAALRRAVLERGASSYLDALSQLGALPVCRANDP
jgi:hypothetical protein